MATELKSWPIIGAFQKRVDIYFHLLSVPRGKGGFYLFVGLLTFCASEWGVSSLCVMVVAIVGVLHLAGCPRDTRTEGMAASDDTQHHQDTLEPMDAAASASISNFALKVCGVSLPRRAHTRKLACRAPPRMARPGVPGNARQP